MPVSRGCNNPDLRFRRPADRIEQGVLANALKAAQEINQALASGTQLATVFPTPAWASNSLRWRK